MGLFYAAEQRGLKNQECSDALVQLEANAIHEGSEQVVALRVAHLPNQVILDLGGPSWEAIVVTPDGWSICPAVGLSVRFKRPAGLMALPTPKPAGDLTKLRDILNTDDEGINMAVAWVLFAIGGAGPYPILALAGEQGTGKSTAARVLREIVDPNSVGLRTTPKEERDLAIAAQNAHVLGFDNLSAIPEWLADGLCRLATGAGYATRALYTDSEETLFSARRPVIINGIPDLMTRGDLADRALAITLDQIKDDDRRPENEVWQAVEEAKPEILGGLLDAVSMALRRLPDLKMSAYPRMADFARFVVAAEPALPWKEGDFLGTYTAAREDGARNLLEGDLIYPLVAIITKAGNDRPNDAPSNWRPTPDIWIGTAGELLACLNHARGESRPPRGWPATPRGLSSHLRRITPAMRQTGLEVEYGKGGGKMNARIITISRAVPNRRNRPSEPSDQSRTQGDQRDSDRTQNSGDRPKSSESPTDRANPNDEGRSPKASVRPEEPDKECDSDGSDCSDGSFVDSEAESEHFYTVDL